MSNAGSTTGLTSAQLVRTSPIPVVSAVFGFVAYAVAMWAGELFEVNSDPHPGLGDESLLDSLNLPEMGIGLVGAGIAVWLARRALSGSMTRTGSYALGLAVAATITIPVVWAGWPVIFGAVAVGLAYEQRRRVGSLSGLAGAAAVLGGAAFVVGTVICVFG